MEFYAEDKATTNAVAGLEEQDRQGSIGHRLATSNYPRKVLMASLATGRFYRNNQIAQEQKVGRVSTLHGFEIQDSTLPFNWQLLDYRTNNAALQSPTVFLPIRSSL